MLGTKNFLREYFRMTNQHVKEYLIRISRNEGKKSAVEQRRQFATRRRLGRTSSCGILLNTRFGILPSFIYTS